jgi:hypothetical protein
MIDTSKITDRKAMCVYKIQFEDGRFYIGAAENIGRRIGNWSARFVRNASITKRINGVPNKTNCSFEVVEIVTDERILGVCELYHIAKNISDPNLMNSVYALSNVKVRRYSRQMTEDRKKKFVADLIARHGRPVIKVSRINGEIVGRYATTIEAAKSNGLIVSKVRDDLYNRKKVIKGDYSFLYLGGARYNSKKPKKEVFVLESEIVDNKIPMHLIPKSRKKLSHASKVVTRFDANGNKIDEFISSKVASEVLGISEMSILHSIYRQNLINGFRFKR